MINKIFSKLTVRNIKSNIKQFLSVIVIVLLSTMLLSGFITNSFTLKKSINNYFDKTNLADIWAYVDGVTDDDRSFFENNEIEYGERLYLETSANITSVKNTNNAKVFVSDGKISNPYVTPNRKKGCFIDQNVVKNYKIPINSTEYFKFNYIVEQEFMGVPIELNLNLSFEINGKMCFDECADTYSTWPVFIDEETFLTEFNYRLSLAIEEQKQKYASILETMGIEINTGDYLLESVPHNQILVKTDDIEKVTEKIENYYASDQTSSNLIYVHDRNYVESVVLLNSEIDQSEKMIYVFPVIFLVVSVLVILTTINHLVLQEKTKIGTLKSIGIPDRKILRHYSMYGAWLCSIGSIIGILLGVLIIPNIMFVKYNLVYSLPADYIHLSIPWYIIFVFIGVALLGYIVSLFACYNILHKKPIECLRQDININAKNFGKAKKSKKLPLGIKMAFRNIRIKPIRTIMATIGIMGCVALLLCGFGIQDTIINSIYTDLGGNFKYDITTTYTSEDFEQKLIENENVDLAFYEKYSKFYVEARSDKKLKNLNLYEIAESSRLTEIKIGGEEVCISKSVANELGVKVGDKVTVSLGGTNVELIITTIKQTSFMNGIYVCRDLGFNNLLGTYGMWLKCNSVSDGTVDYINSVNGTNDAYTLQGMTDLVMSKVSSIDIMTNTLKTFAILLAIVVLMNLIFLIMKERVKEIATLKVLGQGILNIGASVFYEILIMTLLGTFVGMFLGFPLLIWVLSINKVEILNFIYHINPLSFVLSVIIILATIGFVSLFSLLKIKKINMIESLKSVE